MNCKNCGCALDSGADICYACGTPVDAQAPVQETRDPYLLEDPLTPNEASQEPETQQPEAQTVPVDNAQKAGLFSRIVSFLFALVGLILYGVQRKNGEEAKAISVANAIMAGLCAKMALAILIMAVNLIVHR